MSRKNISEPSADAEAERRAAFEGEVPELGPDFFRGARLRVGDRVVRPATATLTGRSVSGRGRPPIGRAAKVQQSLRLSPEVIEHFRGTGPGWQARMDEVLLRHVREAQAETRRVAEERKDYRADE
jgi:uncharacterized protein (DUF4415 family)